MMLQALSSYYDRIPNAAPPGFSREKISFCLVLNEAGELQSVEDLRVVEGGRPRPTMMTVPYPGKKAVNILASFLWGNTGYALGIDEKGRPERTEATFAAFQKLHREAISQVDDVGLRTLVGFLERWNPRQPDSRIAASNGLIDSNLVFRVAGQRQYLHESPTCREWWDARCGDAAQAGPTAMCLVTGNTTPIATLHAFIKGVSGAQTMGAAISSYNLPAFESYGKEQNLNAPVSHAVAFRYATALNQLLSDRKHRAHIADATVVWWTEKPTQIEDIFGNLLDNSAASDDEVLRDQLGRLVETLQTALPDQVEIDAQVPFYLLGLSPNASRLSIRIWQISTVAELSQRLGAHFRDLAICGKRDSDPPLSLRWILGETVWDARSQREIKEVSPLLGGAVLKSVLSGGLYPDALFASVVRRVRADGTVNYARAAIIKAWLNRKFRTLRKGEELPMSLDVTRADPAYLLGRLFAALEKVQEDASGGSLNRTVKDGFFTSAAATPAAIFPRLLKLSHHHQRKLNGGLSVVRNRLIQDIMASLQTFPSLLPLEDQGVFYIGYYHQRQDLFTRKEQPANGK